MRERSEAAKELSSQSPDAKIRDRCSFKTNFQETDFIIFCDCEYK